MGRILLAAGRSRTTDTGLPGCRGARICGSRRPRRGCRARVDGTAVADRRVRRLGRDINRWLADRRDPTLEHLSWIGSTLAGGIVIPVVVGFFLVAFLAIRRWRLAAVVLFVICIESGAYRATTLFVHRDRPAVDRLESLRSTRATRLGTRPQHLPFTEAVLLLASRARRSTVTVVACGLLVAIPLFVAWSRMYRGMHHLTDSVAGLLLGVGALVVTVCCARRRGGGQSTRRSGLHRPEPRAGMSKVAVIAHAGKTIGSRARGAPRDPLAGRCGRPDLVGGAEEPHGAQACACSTERRDRVNFVWGGDGMVQQCVNVVAGKGVPLAIVPAGTANLFASSLALPRTSPRRCTSVCTAPSACSTSERSTASGSRSWRELGSMRR